MVLRMLANFLYSYYFNNFLILNAFNKIINFILILEIQAIMIKIGGFHIPITGSMWCSMSGGDQEITLTNPYRRRGHYTFWINCCYITNRLKNQRRRFWLKGRKDFLITNN